VPAFARRPVLVLSGAVALLLLAVSGRYGYHRDELYFLASGRHLAWGYPDQPPLTPLLARLMSSIAPGSLPVLRLPSDLAMGATVYLTGCTAWELGAQRSAQVLAAACLAVSAVVLAAGHLLSTTTIDLALTTAFVWLVVRILRTGRDRLWLPAGAVAGAALFDKGTIAAVVLVLVAALLVAGPRSVFRSRWWPAGAVVAAALWAPYLVWQARHGWPQLTVAGDIAGGGSGTSAPRTLFVPMLAVLVSPFLAPVWVTGLVRLLRAPALRPFRALGVAFLLLSVLVLLAGGKPYYVAGMLPLLLAAGSQPVVDWACDRPRRAALAAAFALSLPVMVVTLPLLPAATLHRTSVVALNYDAGETVGWPSYVAQIARVYDAVPAGERAAILASNYGEAGAVDRYGPASGLPRAHSGHNGYWYWGPPVGTRTVIAVGFGESFLRSAFRQVRPAGRLDNGLDVDDDEQGASIWVCGGPRAPWPEL